jgi:hypothetical protein
MARKRRRRNPPSVYLACAAILGALCLLYWGLTSKRLAPDVPDMGTASDANRRDAADVRPASIGTPSRAIYPHSVIPGGAYSVAELEAALRNDPVAAAHYADFDPSHMRIAPAPDSAAVYVSYRQGDRIYWTRRKVRLAAQEALLTDGVHAARARCGNRISLTPQQPVRAAEPSDNDLDFPEPPPTANPLDPAAAQPDMFSRPIADQEIFPVLPGNGLPGGVPGAVGGASAGLGAFGEMPFWGLLEETPLLPGYTLAPPFALPLPLPMPGVGPIIGFLTLPLPPFGPGFLWSRPTPLPGGYGTGSISGHPPVGTAPAPPAVWGLTLIPGIPGVPVNPPPSFTLPGPALPPMPGTGLSTGALLPPNAAVSLDPAVPEPATAALLLCGAAILACRRLFRRRLD